MFHLLYIEREIKEHPLVKKLKKRFKLPEIFINRYGEIFNRNNQNFRLQKNHMALILAKKYGKFLHPIPKNYGIGSEDNYYFSHILNCPFDCSYCFLQGMYKSAYIVLFVNYEDFQEEIAEKTKISSSITFFSGYDGDSLALEPISSFAEHFLPFMERYKSANFELRTKSIFIRPLLDRDPLPNCIVAYSLNPEEITTGIEKKTPPLCKRLESLARLQKAGWPIGLRFDPLVLCDNFKETYRTFFKEVFSKISPDQIHSVTLGTLRLPRGVYNQMLKNNPHDKLLATLDDQKQFFSYPKALEADCLEMITNYISEDKIYAINHRN